MELEIGPAQSPCCALEALEVCADGSEEKKMGLGRKRKGALGSDGRLYLRLPPWLGKGIPDEDSQEFLR